MNDYKELVVYCNDSFEKFYPLWKKYTYEVGDAQQLIVNSRDPATGEENEVARFRNWDYLTIKYK